MPPGKKQAKESKMSKTPKGKQPNTLFSYFQRTPKSESKESKKSEDTGNDVLSPRRSPNDRDKTPSSAKKGFTPLKNGAENGNSDWFS